MLETRTLGKSDIEITPLGLGAWQFSEGKSFTGFVWKELSREVTVAIIEKALERGINWFDTAEAYGSGKSEKGLASGLSSLGKTDDEIIIATKWFPLFKFAGNIRKNIDERIEKLDPYSVDLYQIHQPFSFSGISAQMNAMADVADLGKIKTIGVSNFNESRMCESFEELEKRGYPLVSNQVKYSLLDRSIEDDGILDAAKELGITIIAYSPLEMGLLTGKFHADKDLLKSRPFFRRWSLSRKIDKSQALIDLLNSIAEEVDATPAQVALNWTVTYHGDTVVAIPGASKVSHVDQNGAAMNLELSKEQLSAIEEETQQFI